MERIPQALQYKQKLRRVGNVDHPCLSGEETGIESESVKRHEVERRLETEALVEKGCGCCRLLPLLLVAHQLLMVRKTLLMKITCFDHGTWRDKAGTDLESSPLLASFRWCWELFRWPAGEKSQQ